MFPKGGQGVNISLNVPHLARKLIFSGHHTFSLYSPKAFSEPGMKCRPLSLLFFLFPLTFCCHSGSAVQDLGGDGACGDVCQFQGPCYICLELCVCI